MTKMTLYPIIERQYVALFRCKAPWAQRRQKVVATQLRSAAPPAAEQVARLLISQAQAEFECDVRYLIIDRVLL